MSKPERVALIDNGVVTAVLWMDAALPEGVLSVPCPLPSEVEPGWWYVNGVFELPAAPPVKTLFDGAEFLARLTDAEYGAILSASAQSIQLARWLDILRLRGEIDVTGSTARAAKSGLVKGGLLTSDRADVIFAPG